MQFKDLIIVCGHYGCGKTNFSINLACMIKAQGKEVTLIDLDIVNPYFRTSDYPELLELKGIKLAASHYAHSNLDIPALTSEMQVVLNGQGTVIVDVGGDEQGAAALGRFNPIIKKRGYQMLYLINKYRIMTQDADEALSLLKDIEVSSRLEATEIVNNSHLKSQTQRKDILSGIDFARDVSEASGLPLLMSTTPKNLFAPDELLKHNLSEVDIFVKTDWE